MQAFLKVKKNREVLAEIPEIFIQAFPYPPGVCDMLISFQHVIMSMFILMSYLYPCVSIVKSIVEEKEKKIKQSMEIMGGIVSLTAIY